MGVEIKFHFLGVIIFGQSIFSTSIGDGQSSITTKGTRRDLDTWWGLAAFVFVDVYGANDTGDQVFVEALGDNVLQTEIVFNIEFENRVQHRIGGQAIGVFLIVAQFCCGWALYDR